MLNQPVEQRNLRLLDFEPGFGHAKEAGFVDLRERADDARTERPLRFESVAAMRVPLRHVPLASPRMHELAALLLNLPERQKRPGRAEP
jgi:hypothetical protein